MPANTDTLIKKTYWPLVQIGGWGKTGHSVRPVIGLTGKKLYTFSGVLT